MYDRKESRSSYQRCYVEKRLTGEMGNFWLARIEDEMMCV